MAIFGNNGPHYKTQKYIYIIFCFSSLFSFLLLIIYIENLKAEMHRFLAVNVYNRVNLSNNNEFTLEKILTVNSDDIACHVPKLNPWDPIIMKGVKHPRDVYCPHVQPYLTFIDDDGYLRINKTEQNQIHGNNRTFSCVYWTFDRSPETIDSRLSYDDKMNLTKPVKLSKDYVKVQCNYDNVVKNENVDDDDDDGGDSDENKFYWNYHAHPSEMRINKSHFLEPTEDQLSVVVFILDSVSDSAMQRNLPLTLNYTSTVMGMNYFKGNMVQKLRLY